MSDSLPVLIIRNETLDEEVRRFILSHYPATVRLDTKPQLLERTMALLTVTTASPRALSPVVKVGMRRCSRKKRAVSNEDFFEMITLQVLWMTDRVLAEAEERPVSDGDLDLDDQKPEFHYSKLGKRKPPPDTVLAPLAQAEREEIFEWEDER